MGRGNQVDMSEENVYYLYQRIGNELQQELSTLEKLTDLIQIFKDNDVVALQKIYENGRMKNRMSIIR